MKVLVACEYSGIVRDAFIAKGHDAISCDILPTESLGPHYEGNVFDIIDQGFDLMIAHPPCTYLSRAANHVWNKPGRSKLREEGLDFFKLLWAAPIKKICLENPLGYASEVWRMYDQIIQPFYFGDPQMKRTCLWLKNLPRLIHAETDELFYSKTHTARPLPEYIDKNGKKRYFTDASKGSGEVRRKNRAKFFPGIAKAMANQWG